MVTTKSDFQEQWGRRMSPMSIGRPPYSLRHSYVGKEGYPTLAYQCTVDHCGRVLGSTKGFPGAQNDKTIVRFDAFVKRGRQRYKSVAFKLKTADGTEHVEKGL